MIGGPVLLAAAALALGDDSARAGALQRALDARVGGIGGTEIAAHRATTVPDAARPGVDVAWRKRADELATRVAREYYEGRLDDALVTLGGLDAHLNGAPYAPARDRVSLHLWRAAVFLERGDAEAARTPGAAALALDPALAVDEKVFPPSVTKLIAGIRAKKPRTVALTLSGLPPNAQVFVDDRARTGTPIRLPAGEHRVLVTAPGHEWVALDADLPADTTLAIALPPALDPDVRAALLSALRRGSADSSERKRLASFASSLGAEALGVAAAFGPEPRRLAALVYRDERVVVRPAGPDTPAEEAAMLDWIAKRLAPRGRVASRGAPALGLRVDGAMAGGVHVRTLTASQNGTFTAALPAFGPRVRLDAAHGRLVAEAVAGLAVSPDSVDVRYPDGSTARGGGGSTTFARLAAGVRHPAESEGVTFAALAGLSFESHRSNDVAGLFPSYTRAAMEIGLRASVPVRAATVDASLTIVPFGSLSESLEGSSGGSPSVAPGLGLQGRISLPLRSWTLAASLEGERRGARFKGQGSGPMTPPLSGARIEESRIGFSISAGRRF